MMKWAIFKITIYYVLKSALNMIKMFAMTIPITAIVTVVVSFTLKKRDIKITDIEKNKNHKKIICLIAYVATMLQMTILYRSFGSVNKIDLIPFDTPGGVPHIILYAIANALVFFPVGILPPMIWKKMNDLKMILLAGFLGSLFIEICQLVLQCGVCQTEDLIMNTVGAGVGYWIYKKVIYRNTD